MRNKRRGHPERMSNLRKLILFALVDDELSRRDEMIKQKPGFYYIRCPLSYSDILWACAKCEGELIQQRYKCIPNSGFKVTFSRSVAKLERNGYVKKKEDPWIAGNLVLTLTDKGRVYYKNILNIIDI